MTLNNLNPVKHLPMLKRLITVGELLTSAILVLSAVLGFWISTSVRLTALEINQKNTEINIIESRTSFKEINVRLDKLYEGQNDIKLGLKDKQDRK